MLKKKWVKTSIAALLFSCLSVGAMAEQQWVRVSDMYGVDAPGNITEHGSDIDYLCREEIKFFQYNMNYGWQNLPPFTYTGYYWRIASKLSASLMHVQCKIAETVYTPSFTLALHCPYGGKIYQSNPTGCYELREVEPEPPTEEQCAASREQLLLNGTPLLEGCPEFPANDGLCQGQDSFIANRAGTVACIPEDPKESAPCFWIDNFYYEKKGDNERYYYTNPQARQMIYQCMIEHEQVHQRQLIDDTVECRYFDANDEGYSPPFGRMGGVEYLMRPAERLGYLEEKRCFDRTKDQCGSDAQCQAEIEQRRDIVENNWRSNGGGSASS